MHRPLPISLPACLALLITSACSAQNQETMPMNPTVDAPLTGEAGPRRRLNPAPQVAHGIRIVLKDVPGPFAIVEAAAQYDVANAAECGEPQPLSGAIPRISSTETVELAQRSEGEYEGRVYVDRILDEDYYGRGTCRWELAAVRVALRASDDPMATWFVAMLDGASVTAQGSSRRFYSSVHYPEAEIDGYSNFGHPSLDHVAEAERAEFFEIGIAATGVAP
jgi:hypothetical protein